VSGPYTATAPANAKYVRVAFRKSGDPAVNVDSFEGLQLERGSVAHGYVPYGDYVGLEVHKEPTLYKDGYWIDISGIQRGADSSAIFSISPSNLPRTLYVKSNNSDTATIRIHGYRNGTWLKVVSDFSVTANTNRVINLGDIQSDIDELRISTLKNISFVFSTTTPIPLPSRGWVGALPDGTADTLTLDGAGKVTWERKTNETTQAVTDGVTGTVGVDVLSSTGQIADGAKVLYKLTTPVTEQRGYVDLPAIPEGASISIPELDGLNVKYRLSLPTVLAGYEDRIKALEEAIAELATS
jgi:hypothetical protein